MRAAAAGALGTAIDRAEFGPERTPPQAHGASAPIPEWIAWAIIAGAGLIRLAGIAEWSLWEDEETAIYFALNPERSFPRAFPLFFKLLAAVFQVTGVSIFAGRLMVAIIGTLTLIVAYLCARRVCGQPVALVALTLMALSPGHLFWSQSIRYYGLVLLFQLVSIWCFLEGLARTRRRWLLLSAASFLAALATHYSAALIAPVYGLFLLSLARRRRIHRRYWIAAGAFAALLAIFIGFGYGGFVGLRHIIQGGYINHVQFPFALITAGTAYFGPPAVLLAVLALLRTRRWSQEFTFFALLGTLPALELVIIRYQGLMFYVLWYYGLVALFGVSVLAGWALVDLWRTVSRSVTISVGVLALTVYIVQLAAYFGPAHGDRPRWHEAAAHVSARVSSANVPVPRIYAGVPGVVAHYLGVPPGRTMGHPLVQGPPPPLSRLAVDSWYIVEERLIEPDMEAWYAEHCTVSARFPSRMLIRDRTLVVFECRKWS